MFVHRKLHDGNPRTISARVRRVLEIEPHELVFLPLKPFLVHAYNFLDFGGVVRVDDIKLGRAMCDHGPIASAVDCSIHGVGHGEEEDEEEEDEGDEERERCLWRCTLATGVDEHAMAGRSV